jgi:hypothetical protein
MLRLNYNTANWNLQVLHIQNSCWKPHFFELLVSSFSLSQPKRNLLDLGHELRFQSKELSGIFGGIHQFE